MQEFVTGNGTPPRTLAAGLIATAYGLDGIIPAVGLETESLLAFAIYDACKGIASSVYSITSSTRPSTCLKPQFLDCLSPYARR